jgi:hypothetical protein
VRSLERSEGVTCLFQLFISAWASCSVNRTPPWAGLSRLVVGYVGGSRISLFRKQRCQPFQLPVFGLAFSREFLHPGFVRPRFQFFVKSHDFCSHRVYHFFLLADSVIINRPLD